MYIILILALSALLQLLAAYLALRLIRITGGIKAWVAIAIGMVLMALRQVLVLYQIASGTQGVTGVPIGEVIALVASLVLVLALVWIGPLFINATRADQTFREQEERFRLLTEAAFEGIAITEGGHFIEVTEQFSDLFGYQRRELIGKEVTEVIAPEALEEALEKIRSGYDRPYDSVCIKRDGTRFQVEVCGKRNSMKTSFSICSRVSWSRIGMAISRL
jgi:PAS domain S-box-containing protein